MLPVFSRAMHRVLCGALVVVTLAGCASAPQRINPVTSGAQEIAGIAGIPGARH